MFFESLEQRIEREEREQALPYAEQRILIKKRMWRKRRRIAYGVFAFIGLIVWFGYQPLEGPVQVGICRTYAELKLAYPDTFRITTYETFERSTRLYYTYIEPFGQFRSEMIDCKFLPPRGPIPQIEAVEVNRIVEDDDKVEEFDRTIPSIMANKPDLIIPRPYSGTFEDLKRE
jgi:hypothetical protein